jgi:hydrogenase expression/formation protein HypD
MQKLDNFRDSRYVGIVLEEIRRILTNNWVIMEICGGQTHAIMHYGLDKLFPAGIELVHGPGCPVCVTSLELVDKAHAIASQKDVIFCSFGDMLRVPGSNNDLFSIRATGGNIRIVYSPLDAVNIAVENPDKQIVFFAIGFETTAPANISSVLKAKALNLKNYSILTSMVRVPPAMHAILGSPNNRVQGFLAAGHVCAVMGYWEYPPIAEKYHIPITVTGFEPLDLVNGILMTVKQLEAGTNETQNAYSRLVTFKGNTAAQEIIDRLLMPCDRNWRGIGLIPQSGWKLKPEYADFDAECRFNVDMIKTKEAENCIAGLILQGIKKPSQCPAFASQCTPEKPLGATMVSSEGACAAYYRYARTISSD